MESMLYLLYLQLLFASLIVHSFVGGAPTIIDIDPTSIQDDTVKHKKHTNDKTYSHQSRSLHESHTLKMKHNLRNMILDDLNERRRSIEEGDWMFINEYLDNINLNITINETFDFLGIDFELVSLTCDELRISDIDTEGSASTQYDLGFSISGISLSCVLNYSYQGGFLVGSGAGSIEVVVGPGTSIDTIITFLSSNFDTEPPSDVSLSCAAQIDLQEIDFESSLLNTFVSPFLPAILEPIMEPLICEPIEMMETTLSDTILGVSALIEDISGPLTPAITDNLYPEKKFVESIGVNFVNLMPLRAIVEFISNPVEGLVKWLNGLIFGDDGVLKIPILLPIADDIDLIEVRLLGFNNFTHDALSLIGNYTFESKYIQDYVGVEIDLAVKDENNMTDIVLVETGIYNLEVDFAMLVVLERLLTFEIILSGFDNIIDCLSNSLFALEVASLSLTAGSLKGFEISGLTQLLGPQQMINTIFEAIFFMFDDPMLDAVNFFFESTVRGAINDQISSLLKTCLESVSGRTVYLAAASACMKIELFDGGVLAADYSDPDCSSEFHNSTQSLGLFDNITENEAYFTGGEMGWGGKIFFKEDPKLPSPQLNATLDQISKVFDMTVVLPSCSRCDSDTFTLPSDRVEEYSSVPTSSATSKNVYQLFASMCFLLFL